MTKHIAVGIISLALKRKLGVACRVSFLNHIMSTSESCKDSASKSNDDGVCDVNDKLQNMSMGDVSVCANCCKEGISDNMNTCNKCNMVKYCNAVCKKVHKKKHKKECEEYIRLAAEKHNENLRRAAELHDEKLFKQPPPPLEDCPICFLRMPILKSGKKYMTCCGKVICSGCAYAPVYDNQGNEVDEDKQNQCPFCRTLAPKSDEEIIERTMKRVEVNDPFAIYNQGNNYRDGKNGFKQSYAKALECWYRSGNLGHALAYNDIGFSHQHGRGVKVDKEKAMYYYELAAMGGNEVARHNLGINEGKAGNIDRAFKHLMIAVRGGSSGSLDTIRMMHLHGEATKEDYTKALQSYQTYLGEIKSKQRDEAAKFDKEMYQYY